MQLSSGYHRRPQIARFPTSDINALLTRATSSLDELKPAPVRAMSLVNRREHVFEIDDTPVASDALFDRGYDLMMQTAGVFEVHCDTGEVPAMRYEAIQLTRQLLRALAISFLDALSKYRACVGAWREADAHDRELLTMDGHAASAHVQWNGWIFHGAVEAATAVFGSNILPKPTDAAKPVKHKAYEKGVLELERIMGNRIGHSRECMVQADNRPRPPVDGYDEMDGETHETSHFAPDFKNRTVRVFHTFEDLRLLNERADIVAEETGERPSLEYLAAQDFDLFASEEDEIREIYAELTDSTGHGPAAIGMHDGFGVQSAAHANAIIE